MSIEKAKELIIQASVYKENPEDFFQVILKVIIVSNLPKVEGWDTLVKVKEILAVSYPEESGLPRLEIVK